MRDPSKVFVSAEKGFEKISHLALVKPLAAHLEVELRALKVFLQLRLNLLCLGKFDRRLVVHILR